MKNEVIIVGSYNQDLTWNTNEFPVPGETTVGTFCSGPGGKGSNQAVAAARAGAQVHFVGAVGNDTFGQALPDFYNSEHIQHHLAVKKGVATGNAGIWVNGEGQNEIIVALGANTQIKPADLPLNVFENATAVVCQHECNLEINAHVFDMAKQKGVTTILNPAPMREDFDKAILHDVDILIPNETEFAFLMRTCCGLKDFSEESLKNLAYEFIHQHCRNLGVETVLLTLGSKGVFISIPDQFFHVPAHNGIHVVDTCGAGDAFIGGFVAHFARTKDILESVKFGNATAALSVTKAGTTPSMPQEVEIKKLLGSNY